MLKFLCIFPLLVLTRSTLPAQSYYFRHYSVEHGLSNNTVVCSLQDKMGFMWFGTKDGLNRFDGYAFKTFRKNGKTSGSIGNNSIHFLLEDSGGILWVATEKGLYSYINETEEFKPAPLTANFYISKIAEDRIGNLWLVARDALYRYHVKTGKIETYDRERFFAATNICVTPDGTVWIGTSGGRLMRYHPNTNSFSGFDLFDHSKQTGSKWIESLYATSDGRLLAGTSRNEVKLIDPFNTEYEDIALANNKQSDLYIRTIQQSGPDEFWLGTESGIFVYNTRTSESHHLKKKFNDPYSLTDNAIYTLCRDREGGIWVGTYFGGINYLPNDETPFTKYFPQQGDNALSGNVISSIVKDHQGDIWIGTEDAGLNKLNPKTGAITNYLADSKPGSISFFNIHGLLATGNELWIGTFNHGLDIMDIRTGKVTKHYEASSDGFTHNFIYGIYQLNSGQVLVATPRGIFAYNHRQDRFELFNGFPPNTWYTTVLEDSKGKLWAGSFGNGLHYFDPETGNAMVYKYNENDSSGISSNRINALFEDSDNRLWIATEDGLCQRDPGIAGFRKYNTTNGFPSDFMFSILEDDRRNLWVSTTKGLVCLNPTSGKPQVYTVSNGLLSNQFNYNSAYRDTSGRLYFGSTKGLISFLPDTFKPPGAMPPVYITALQINNDEVDRADAGSPLEKSITYTPGLTLTHRQSNFSLGFAALSYTAPDMFQYAYSMDGLSHDWISLKKNRRVFFNELPPGDYTFRVRVLNNDGSLKGPETKMDIRILPAWWNSNWARAAYMTIAVLIIFYLLRFYHNWIEEKNRRKLELLQSEKEKEILRIQLANEKEMLRTKIDFFTNVAHEIKTPLTLIKAPLKIITEEIGHHSKMEPVLQIMNRNTNRLIDLAGQLLDFRQTEINQFHLSIERVEISALLREACTDFATLAQQKNISLSFDIQENPFFAFVDTDVFKKILYNLLGNAVKYASKKIVILMAKHPAQNTFSILIKSDGYLIPEELKEKIFEPFFRVRETDYQTGTGIGLALSRSLAQLHGGSLALGNPEEEMNTFQLILPIHPFEKI